MVYKLLKPEITSVFGATWNELKTDWSKLRTNRYFWFIVCGCIIVVILLPPLIGAPSFYFFYVLNKVRSTFRKQIAETNGWQYKENTDPSKEAGIMFQQGSTRVISRCVDGDVDGRKFRMFDYVFHVGEGKNRKSFPYTVFAFKFNGSFPHIYLNNRHNSHNIMTGERVPLPSEFEKQFSLSAPRKYEIEALEIFTPDILAKLLDGGFTHDIEFIEGEVLMFVDGTIDNFEKLEKEFNKALELEDLLDEKLDRFKFNPIGDMPYQLK